MKKKIAAALSLMLIICGVAAAASAEATLSVSPTTPVTGQEITFSVGTTMDGLEAVINTTGLSFVRNTGLGNSNRVISVPGMQAEYVYTVTANPGETVSFILSDVNESDADGNEVPGQRAVWMATAVAQQSQPSESPTVTPSDTPSQQPSSDPSTQPSDTPSEQPSGEPSTSGSPAASPTAAPTTAGNPSPTVAPSSPQDGTSASNNPSGGAAGSISGGTNSGGSSGGTSAGGSSGGGAPPKTGDLTHFLALLGVIGALLLVIVIAGRKVFAEE